MVIAKFDSTTGPPSMAEALSRSLKAENTQRKNLPRMMRWSVFGLFNMRLLFCGSVGRSASMATSFKKNMFSYRFELIIAWW